jgi:plasmid stability protein
MNPANSSLLAATWNNRQEAKLAPTDRDCYQLLAELCRNETVPSLLIRNVDASLHSRLKQRAAAHHRSLEEEVRALLRVAITRQPQEENIVDLAKRLFGPKQGIDLPIPSRREELERPVPDFSGPEYDP